MEANDKLVMAEAPELVASTDQVTLQERVCAWASSDLPGSTCCSRPRAIGRRISSMIETQRLTCSHFAVLRFPEQCDPGESESLSE